MSTDISQRCEIIISSGGSVQPALDFVADAFHAATGHTVRITYRHDIDEPDVLVMPKDAIDRKSGFVGEVEDGAISIGSSSSGIGVAVRLGAAVPDVSSVDVFVNSLHDADRILLSDRHSSCLHMFSVFKNLGIYEQLETKFQFAAIAQLLIDRLLSGHGNEIMLLSINAMRAYGDERIVLAGPLPETLQNRIEFFAVPRTASVHKDVAWDFVRFCAGPGRKYLLANGFT